MASHAGGSPLIKRGNTRVICGVDLTRVVGMGEIRRQKAEGRGQKEASNQQLNRRWRRKV